MGFAALSLAFEDLPLFGSLRPLLFLTMKSVGMAMMGF
jgi:hypothetical protein